MIISTRYGWRNWGNGVTIPGELTLLADGPRWRTHGTHAAAQNIIHGHGYPWIKIDLYRGDQWRSQADDVVDAFLAMIEPLKVFENGVLPLRSPCYLCILLLDWARLVAASSYPGPRHVRFWKEEHFDSQEAAEASWKDRVFLNRMPSDPIWHAFSPQTQACMFNEPGLRPWHLQAWILAGGSRGRGCESGWSVDCSSVSQPALKYFWSEKSSSACPNFGKYIPETKTPGEEKPGSFACCPTLGNPMTGPHPPGSGSHKRSWTAALLQVFSCCGISKARLCCMLPLWPRHIPPIVATLCRVPLKEEVHRLECTTHASKCSRVVFPRGVTL